MDKRISRALAATLAAATLAGGTAAPVWADQPTAGGAATRTGQRAPIAGLAGVTARWRDAQGGTGPVTGFDPANGRGGDVPAGTTAVTLDGLPDGWTQSVSKDDPLTVTLAAPDQAQSRTYTFRAVSAADRFRESLKKAETIRDDRDATDAYDRASLDALGKAIGDAGKLDADTAGDQGTRQGRRRPRPGGRGAARRQLDVPRPDPRLRRVEDMDDRRPVGHAPRHGREDHGRQHVQPDRSAAHGLQTRRQEHAARRHRNGSGA